MRADRPHSECLLDACRWLFLWVGPAGVGKLSGSGTGVPACCYCGPGWASSRSPGGVLLQLRLLVFRIVWRRVCRVGVPLPAECLGRGMQPVVMATGLRHFSSARAAFVPDVAKFFASIGRLRRLVTANQCREQWGAFKPDGPIPAEGHAQAPPVACGTQLHGGPPEMPSDSFCWPLLVCLLGVDDCDSSALGGCGGSHCPPGGAAAHRGRCTVPGS